MTAPRKVARPKAGSPRAWSVARAATRGWRLAAVAALAALVGCAHAPAPPIQPWQREHLSKRAMRFDAEPLEARFRQHMFGSREASDGGYGQPGGGCGCN